LGECLLLGSFSFSTPVNLRAENVSIAPLSSHLLYEVIGTLL
jgi:hypothetical protein